MQVEVLEAKTETFPFGAAEVAAMSAPRPARVWPRPAAGLRIAWGMARILVLRHPSASTPSSRRQSVGDRSPRSGQALLVSDRSRPVALGGRGLPQGLGSASGLSRHPGCPQALLRLMRENNLLSPHRCRRRGGNPHDGEIVMARWLVRDKTRPSLDCPLAIGPTVDRDAGLTKQAGPLQYEAIPLGCRAIMAEGGRRLADHHGSASICRRSQPDQGGSQPSIAGACSSSPTSPELCRESPRYRRLNIWTRRTIRPCDSVLSV